MIFSILTNDLQIRLGGDTNDDVDEDPTGNKALWDRGLLNGASQKTEVIANFHVGETVNTLEVRPFSKLRYI